MLRVGLTGELGSGKSMVAGLLAEHGAVVLSSDEMARAMMQPGDPVYREIVQAFGPTVVLPDGSLNRPELARLAFHSMHPRAEALNAIIHPAVLAEQERQIAEIAHATPNALVIIESALIFTTKHGGGEPWRERFDRIVLVTAPDELKVRRFVQRVAAGRELSPADGAALEADAHARLAAQRIPADLTNKCIVIDNTGSTEALAHRTEEVFRELRSLADHVQAQGKRL